ncbi:hypothetical protein SDC9_109775 [bioreactor metagenome]|uniref:Uncharacterized protein n=1 Tax=bioreactor metagenome TaxID=1076179 RepID=A0A645BC54_9ZZZZ
MDKRFALVFRIRGAFRRFVDAEPFDDVDQLAFVVDFADAAGYVPVFRERVLRFVADHGEVVLLAVARALEIVVQNGEGALAVVIVRVDGGKRFMYNVLAAEDGVRRAPGLDAVFRHGEPGGEHRFRLLKDIVHFQMLFGSAADDLVKVVLDLAVDDEYDLLKPRLHCVEERIVHDDFAVAADRVDLLESAVTAAHTGGHDNESGFLHA